MISVVTSFIILLGVTGIFVYLYARRSIDSFIHFSLDEVEQVTLSRVEIYFTSSARSRAEWIAQVLAEKGVAYSKDPKLSEELKEGVQNNVASEMDVINSDGIVTASSDSRNIGFDIHNDPNMSEFLCLLDGETDYYVHDFFTTIMNGETLMYRGVAIPIFGGMYLEGVDQETYAIDKESKLGTQVHFDRLGRGGYFLLTDQSGVIVSSTEGIHEGETFIPGSETEELAQSGRIVKEDVFDTESYIGVRRDGNHLIIAVYPLSEAWEQWTISMIILIVIYTSVFAAILLVMRRLITGNVVKGVYSLDGSLKRITAGDLDEKADFRVSVEFDELSDGINFMVDRLKGLIKEAEERIDAELALAAKTQASILPHDFPAFPERDEFELYAAMDPAKEVGGDFYDFFLVDDDHLALVMGDVSGKGIPASMFMVMAKDKIRNSVMKHGMDVSAAVSEVNTELMKENGAKLFVTVWLGVLTVSSGHMDYVNAGHEYPAISRGGEEFRVDEDVHSAPVAARKKTVFEAGAFELGFGDILYLYTDGVTEANDPEGKMFGRERMLDALNKDREAAMEDIDANVRTAVAGFARGAAQFDDTTTLIIKFMGKEIDRIKTDSYILSKP